MTLGHQIRQQKVAMAVKSGQGWQAGGVFGKRIVVRPATAQRRHGSRRVTDRGRMACSLEDI